MANSILVKSTLSGSIAESLITDIANKTNRYFYFLGKNTGWGYDYSPDIANDSYFNELNTRSEIVYLKSITPSEVSLVANRIDWKSGTVFDPYDDSYSTEIIGINLISGGSGYITPPTVTIMGTGTGATATAVIPVVGGSVTGVVLTSRGSGYTNSSSNPPTVIFSDGSFFSTTTTSDATTGDGGITLNLTTVQSSGQTVVLVGQTVSGTNVTPGTTVVSVVENAVTLSQMISDTVTSGTTITFKNNAIAVPVLSNAQNNVSKLEDSKFYVLTDDFNVYVCLDNNLGSPSTVKPTGTSDTPLGLSPTVLSDGYVWKYLYTVPASLRGRFLTTKYFPVSTSLKRQFTSNGQIRNVVIDNPGSGYTTSSMTISGDGYRSTESITISGKTFRESEPWLLNRVSTAGTATAGTVIAGGLGYGISQSAVACTVTAPYSSSAWAVSSTYVAGQYVSYNPSGTIVHHYVVVTPGSGVTTASNQPSLVQYNSFTTGDGYVYLYVGTTAAATVATNGSGAVTSISFTNNIISDVVVSAGGSGYTDGSAVSFSGGGASSNASGIAVVSGGVLLGIKITNGGFGYTSNPTFTISGGGSGATVSTYFYKSGSGYSSIPTVSPSTGTGAQVTPNTTTTIKSEGLIFPILSSGKISSVYVSDPGVGYTAGSVTISGDGTLGAVSLNLSIGSLTTQQATTEINAVSGAIYSIPVVSGGYGYSSIPTVTIVGDGTGATAIVKTLANKAVKQITVTNGGTGYTYATIIISGDGSGATARPVISPFGGHGKNSVRQLFSRTVMFYSYLSKDTVNGVKLGSKYRQLGLIRNPQTPEGKDIVERTATPCWTLSSTSIPAQIVSEVTGFYVPFGTISATYSSGATQTSTQSSTIVVSSVSGISVGMGVYSNQAAWTTIPRVLAINGTTITLSGYIPGISGSGTLFFSNDISRFRTINITGNVAVVQSLDNKIPVTSGTFYYGGFSFTISSVSSPSFNKSSGDFLYLDNQIPFTPRDLNNEIITVSSIIKF